MRDQPAGIEPGNASGQQKKNRNSEKNANNKHKIHGRDYHRGSRIKAIPSSKGASVTLSYDHALNSDENHRKAAAALKAKIDWKGRMIGGHTEPGMVWVFDNERAAI